MTAEERRARARTASAASAKVRFEEGENEAREMTMDRALTIFQKLLTNPAARSNPLFQRFLFLLERLDGAMSKNEDVPAVVKEMEDLGREMMAQGPWLDSEAVPKRIQ